MVLLFGKDDELRTSLGGSLAKVANGGVGTVDGRNPAPPVMYETLWYIYHMNWCAISSINSTSQEVFILSSLDFYQP